MASSPATPRIPTLPDFEPATVRGQAGFFRVGRTRAGAWWLIDPFDRGLFVKAVAGVSPSGRTAAPFEGEAAARSPVPRLRSWGFNALGAGSVWTRDSGMYGLVALDFRTAGPRIHAFDTDLPDVFDPAWLEAVRGRAASICAPLAPQRELVGYFTDTELRWPPAGRPGLLQVCLSLEPGSRAYHAAWEFALAGRQGDVRILGRDWGLSLPGREVVRRLTLEGRPLAGAVYQNDEYQFTREFARRYHLLAAAAIREHDSRHLILGCRWTGLPAPAVLREALYPATDVLSLQSHDFDDWPDHLGALAQVQSGPVLLCGVRWHPPAAVEEPLGAFGIQELEQRLREGSQALQEVVALPELVGYEWGAWRSRADAAPFFLGLVREDDQPVPEHTDVLRALNGHIERWRENGAEGTT